MSECDKFEVEVDKERRIGKLTVAELDEDWVIGLDIAVALLLTSWGCSDRGRQEPATGYPA